MNGERRPLPYLEGPLTFTGPSVARMMLRLVEPGLAEVRADRTELPGELLANLESLRRTAAGGVSAVGHRVVEGADIGAGSADERETSVEAAGERLDLSGRQVRRLLGEGRLAGRKVGGTWLVDAAALEAHRAARRAAG